MSIQTGFREHVGLPDIKLIHVPAKVDNDDPKAFQFRVLAENLVKAIEQGAKDAQTSIGRLLIYFDDVFFVKALKLLELAEVAGAPVLDIRIDTILLDRIYIMHGNAKTTFLFRTAAGLTRDEFQDSIPATLSFEARPEKPIEDKWILKGVRKKTDRGQDSWQNYSQGRFSSNGFKLHYNRSIPVRSTTSVEWVNAVEKIITEARVLPGTFKIPNTKALISAVKRAKKFVKEKGATYFTIHLLVKAKTVVVYGEKITVIEEYRKKPKELKSTTKSSVACREVKHPGKKDVQSTIHIEPAFLLEALEGMQSHDVLMRFDEQRLYITDQRNEREAVVMLKKIPPKEGRKK